MSSTNDFDFHSPHWHGNTTVVAGMRTDVMSLGIMAMAVADMVPEQRRNVALPLPRLLPQRRRNGRPVSCASRRFASLEQRGEHSRLRERRAGAIEDRPDLFAAAIIGVPIADMLGFETDSFDSVAAWYHDHAPPGPHETGMGNVEQTVAQLSPQNIMKMSRRWQGATIDSSATNVALKLSVSQ